MAGVIAIVALLLAQDLRGTGSIAGVVRDAQSKAAIRRAAVTLELGAADGPTATAVTDDEGRFEFRDLPAGDYRLTPLKDGYPGVSFWSPSPTVAKHLALLDGQRREVDLELEPLAVISGRVLDSDGEPFPHAHVMLQRGKTPGVRGSAQTDDRGEFRIFHVPAGEDYLLVVQSPRDQAQTFYPGATSAESATVIELRTGEERSGFEIRLAKATPQRVRVKVTPPDGVDFGERVFATLHVIARQASTSRTFPVNEWQDIGPWTTSLGPGEHVVSATMATRDGRRYGVSRKVRMEPGVEIDVTLQPQPSFEVPVQLELEGAPSTQAFRVVASTGGQMPLTCALAPGRRCTLDGMTQGWWNVHVEPYGPDFYPKSISIGDQTLTQPLELTAAPDQPLRIAIARTASIHGAVERSETGEALPATVVAVGVGETLPSRFASTDASGGFELKSLHAGTYRIVAFDAPSGEVQKLLDLAKQDAIPAEVVKLEPGAKVRLTLKRVPKP